jgi:hypothetical protein
MTRTVCGLMLVFCGLSAVPVFAQSQPDLSRGPELWPKLKTGATIYVLDANARETAGIFAKASESSIKLLVEGATPPGTLEQPWELAEGTRVRVTGPRGPRDVRRLQTGKFLTMDEKTLTIIDRGGQHVKIPRELVTRLDVSSRQKGHALQGLLIGAAAGAILGASSSDGSCSFFPCPTRGQWAALGGAFFGGIGAGIGRAVKTDKWVETPLDRVSVGLRPGPSGQSGSLSLTVAF